MRTKGDGIRSERGVALPLALFALVMLSGLLLVLLNIGAMEPRMARNHDDTTKARSLADAGTEWGFDTLVTTPSWSTVLSTNSGVMASNMALPGLPATFGTFTVSVRNDDQPGDTALTGVAPDPGGPASDTNRVVIITSTGTANGVTRQIQVVLSGIALNIPGGVNLPGVASNTVFEGNSFQLSGNDTNPDGTPGGGIPGVCPAAGWGIGVADAATEAAVQASLSPVQKDNVTGKAQDPALAGEGDNTIAPDSSLTPANIAKFVNKLKPRANITLQSSAASPLEYQSVGDTCSGGPYSPDKQATSPCWGTPSEPKIVYIKGDVDPTDAFTAVEIAGNSRGAGILILEDADLFLEGAYRWEGLILITGKYVGLNYGGGGEKTVYGGVVINESEVDPNLEVYARGDAKIRYSCQALNNVLSNRSLYSLTAWREL